MVETRCERNLCRESRSSAVSLDPPTWAARQLSFSSRSCITYARVAVARQARMLENPKARPLVSLPFLPRQGKVRRSRKPLFEMRAATHSLASLSTVQCNTGRGIEPLVSGRTPCPRSGATRVSFARTQVSTPPSGQRLALLAVARSSVKLAHGQSLQHGIFPEPLQCGLVSVARKLVALSRRPVSCRPLAIST